MGGEREKIHVRVRGNLEPVAHEHLRGCECACVGGGCTWGGGGGGGGWEMKRVHAKRPSVFAAA